MAAQEQSRRVGTPRACAAVGAGLVAVFAVSVAMRAPWRGHLAPGDQWVTALALRWARAWHRNGAWASRFALVESPPTAEFAGDAAVHKWGLPGHVLLLHALLEPFGLEPTVERLMRINLGLHLLLALVLAALAWVLVRQARPGRDGWAVAAAIHCGAFVLLFPPILYWGQSISCQDFTVLPLTTFVVAGRWLRSTLTARRARTALDAGVAAAVFLGTITEFLFVMLVPYLVAVELLRRRAGRPRAADPWWATLAVPFVLGLVVLLAIFAANGQLGLLRWRVGVWTGAGSGFWTAIAVQLWAFGIFARSHFSDAFGPIGLLVLALAWLRLARPGRLLGLPPTGRGILLDLLVPCVLFSLVLASHEAFHTIAAIKYVPFVALGWTVLVPLIIRESRPSRRRAYAAVYGVVALLAILPLSSAYRDFFPAPEPRWDEEGAFLRDVVPPGDRVFSPATQIDLVPPQRIALAERRVVQAYDPLDVLHALGDVDTGATLAFWAPPELDAAFGAGGADVVRRGPYALARVSAERFRAFLAAQPQATLRDHVDDVLRGELRDGEHALAVRAVPPLPAPVTIHSTDTRFGPLRGWDRLYWTDDRHLHWRAFQPGSPDRESVVLGDDRYGTDWMGLWRRAVAVDEAPIEWGRFVHGLFAPREAGAFRWRGYDVVPTPVADPPALLRTHFPAVRTWHAWLVLAGDTPVGIALGTPDGGRDWVCALFDRPVVDVHLPDDVSTEWSVRSGVSAAP